MVYPAGWEGPPQSSRPLALGTVTDLRTLATTVFDANPGRRTESPE
jgi:hypothetical protein